MANLKGAIFIFLSFSGLLPEIGDPSFDFFKKNEKIGKISKFLKHWRKTILVNCLNSA